ncbi:hypothetical protein DFH07DRAFT_913748 [Mycena maculata]|uniref:Uncharacterized protein n=1 Tax=Mycena maculata TaxID=230809 RepID=A0AAD7JWV2_9AGAR|nr:hypothetical protein DFH07DRAFT_913748 [Mycena maculata]
MAGTTNFGTIHLYPLKLALGSSAQSCMATLEPLFFDTSGIRNPMEPESFPGDSSASPVLDITLTGPLSLSPESQSSLIHESMAYLDLEFSPIWRGKALGSPPPWTFPTPFVAYIPGGESCDQIWGPSPRTLAELRMYNLSWAIRSKEDWQIKLKDPDIRERWREHAMDSQENLPVERRLTYNMINYVLTELEGYLNIADQDTGIERGCFDAVWYSDKPIPLQLSDALKSAVAKLEAGAKDWHPGSDEQVLDLVHPSLHCVVYGRTRAFLPDSPRIEDNLLVVGPPAGGTSDSDWTREFTLSQRFAWLPSDFTVREDGSVRLVSPYINNLHPVLHKSMYHVIESLLATRFVPLFERVLGDLNTRDRVPVEGNRRIRTHRQAAIWPGRRHQRVIPCIWGLNGIPYPESIPEGVDEELFYEEFHTNAPKILPESHRAYQGALEKGFSPISLLGRTIQCIIKLANIHLTPEKPEYKGGNWHFEGMLNERIVASGIYYYDEENISESTLSFRVSTAPPVYHYQDDDVCMEILYDMERGGQCIQNLGSMITKAGRTLAWPNFFQHCVSPFRLTDPTKPGHRKILAFFLVDPAHDPIVSATYVPSQQSEWTRQAFVDSIAVPRSATSNWPVELNECINKHLDTLITPAEADAYRLELVKEHTANLVEYDKTVIQQSWDMCEH